MCFLKTASLLCAFAVLSARAGDLPPQLESALSSSGLKSSEVGLWVAPAGSDIPVAQLNAQRAMKPASSIKTVTTLAALDLLGRDFVWKTDISASGAPDARGVLRRVAIRGDGDPHLVVERIWLLAERLHGLGVRKIEGNITLDRSAFAVDDVDPFAFDGAGQRVYNVGADALLLNLRALSITFVPEADGKFARIYAVPELAGFNHPVKIQTVPGACGDWLSALKAAATANGVSFKGKYRASCGTRTWHVTLWSADDYLTRILKPVLKKAGIEWTGKAVSGCVPAGNKVLLSETSEPLTQIITWINKFSNNPMARQVFLTLSYADGKKDQPASLVRSRKVVSKWLDGIGVDSKDVFIENGSGLSREARISAESLGRVLNHGWKSGVMPEFVASLPAAGYDGAMQKRSLTTGSAHVKTGHLNRVHAVAGYVTDERGERWSVAVIVNGDVNKGKAFTQDVLNWCASGKAGSVR